LGKFQLVIHTQNQEIRPQGLDLGGSTASNQDPEALFLKFEDYVVKTCLKFSVTVDQNNFLVYHKTFLLSFFTVAVFFTLSWNRLVPTNHFQCFIKNAVQRHLCGLELNFLTLLPSTLTMHKKA
jgi:hypothetical protein